MEQNYILFIFFSLFNFKILQIAALLSAYKLANVTIFVNYKFYIKFIVTCQSRYVYFYLFYFFLSESFGADKV